MQVMRGYGDATVSLAVLVHGDSEGAETLRRNLYDWLCDMKLVPAGADAHFDRYIGYYEPYATSHEALDKDDAIQQEVRNAARSLATTITQLRTGGLREEKRPDPRPK